jgi:hypothetical protein
MEVALSSALPSCSGGASAKEMPGPVDFQTRSAPNSASVSCLLSFSRKDRAQPRSPACILSFNFSARTGLCPSASCIFCHSLTAHTRFQILSPEQLFLLWQTRPRHRRTNFPRALILSYTQPQPVVQNGRLLGCEDSPYERVQRTSEREMGKHRGRLMKAKHAECV